MDNRWAACFVRFAMMKGICMGQRTYEQSVQKFQERLEEATRKLSSAQTPEEQSQWAETIRRHAEDFTQSQGRSRSSETALMVEAVVPDAEAFPDIARQLQTSTPGLKEVSFRQDAGRNRIRIQATSDAMPHIQEVLSRVGKEVQRAFSGSSS